MLQIPERSKVAEVSGPGDVTGAHRRDASPLQWLSTRLLNLCIPTPLGMQTDLQSQITEQARKQRCQVVASRCQPGHPIVQPLHLGAGLTYTSCELGLSVFIDVMGMSSFSPLTPSQVSPYLLTPPPPQLRFVRRPGVA